MENEIILIIAGGRDFNDYALVKEKADQLLAGCAPCIRIVIVSGGAKGADNCGERYAKERGHDLKIIRADWDTHGLSAGHRRNEVMAKIATHLLAFWDGQSRGTKGMIDLAKRYRLNTRVVRYDKQLAQPAIDVGSLNY